MCAHFQKIKIIQNGSIFGQAVGTLLVYLFPFFFKNVVLSVPTFNCYIRNH